MVQPKSNLPELTFQSIASWNGQGADESLQVFLEQCDSGLLEGWSCKKTAQVGDVYLFWFCQPAEVLAGVGIVANVPYEDEKAGDWGSAARMAWFCTYEPIIALPNVIRPSDIRGDADLKRWWHGRPFQGGPKRVEINPYGRKLAAMILKKNPRDAHLARFLRVFSLPTSRD